MGLDMYLTANRSFEPESDTARAILAAAGVTCDDLEKMAKQDPREYETYLYLGRYDWMTGDGPARANAVVDIAEMRDLCTEDSPGGGLAWEDGKIVVHVTSIYWRKANAIHGWFVENCQGGVDECQVAPVHPEQLARLRSECEKSLDAYKNDTGEVTLQPRSGFFFGGTAIDDWWVQDLQATIAEIERVITAAIPLGDVTFAYRSSW